MNKPEIIADPYEIDSQLRLSLTACAYVLRK